MPAVSRLAICVVVSLCAHLAIARGLELLPPLETEKAPSVIEVRLVEPPPPEIIETIKPPEEVKPPEPLEAVKPEPVKPQPAARPAQTPQIAAKPHEDVPPELIKHADDSDEGPVFGVDMSSTSQAGNGPGMQVGHGGTGGGGGGGSAAPAPRPPPGGNGDAPIGANEATKMPLPQGRCFGKYTPEATAAGTEGTVVLDLTVGEDGHARDITVTGSLPNGLTQSAIAALRACVFAPGEKDGHAVPVRIRGFKIRFVLQEAQP